MATYVSPAALGTVLRQQLATHGHAFVEYFHTRRDPDTARSVDRAARWLAHHRELPAGNVRVFAVDLALDRGELDRMRVQLLPQPSTVALYGPGGKGIALHAGPVLSSSKLVQEAVTALQRARSQTA